MASEELATVHELLRGVDLDDLTIAERRAAIESVAAPPPPGTTVEPVDAGGVPAEWVIAAGVDSDRVLLSLHGEAYQIGSPATLRRAGAWPWPRWWRCATLVIRCPRWRSRCRPGRTWRSPVSRFLPARTSM